MDAANQQLLYIWKVAQLVYGFLPKPEQAEALWWLLFEKKDLLLVAKTSFGKSLILQLLPCLIRDAIVLILLPLNAIGAEQMEKIQTLPGARPLHLTADNNNNQRLAFVRSGYYSHILVSPEIACSQHFRQSVLSDSRFRNRIKAVMIDEVHLVVDWGLTFRESYTHLRYLRNVLGHKPWFGCTATLDMQSSRFQTGPGNLWIQMNSQTLSYCSTGTQNNKKSDTQSQDIVLPERPKVRKNKKATK